MKSRVKSVNSGNSWRWTDQDIGCAYIRYCDSKGHTKVPANFIKYHVKGRPIDLKYKYKVFWCSQEDSARNTPMKYLKSASSIPTFEADDDAFGEVGCYRAFIYAVKDSEEDLNKWIAEQKRIKETPAKLAYTSFDCPPGASASDTQPSKAQTSQNLKESARSAKGTSFGSLKNVETLREEITARLGAEADPETNGKNSRLLQKEPERDNGKHDAGRKEIKSRKRKDVSDDQSTLPPSKVEALESRLATQQEELRQFALERDRLRKLIEEMGNKSNHGVTAGSNKAAPEKPPADETRFSDEDFPDFQGDKGSEFAYYSKYLMAETRKKATPKRRSAILKEKGPAKKTLQLKEREDQRKRITSLVPIPEDFKYEAEEFNISDKLQINKANMIELWDIGRGEDRDSEFIKTAAVMIFGSKTLLETGVVRGITVKGVKQRGLDPIALEAIRVLLILRVRREGVEVVWNSERTKQSRVNRCLTDKIKSLRISAALHARPPKSPTPPSSPELENPDEDVDNPASNTRDTTATSEETVPLDTSSSPSQKDNQDEDMVDPASKTLDTTATSEDTLPLDTSSSSP